MHIDAGRKGSGLPHILQFYLKNELDKNLDVEKAAKEVSILAVTNPEYVKASATVIKDFRGNLAWQAATAVYWS